MTVIDNTHVFKTFFGGVYKSVCHAWEVQSRMRARYGVIAREPNNDQSWTANSTNPHYSRPQLNIFHCQFPGCIGFLVVLGGAQQNKTTSLPIPNFPAGGLLKF